MRGNGAAKGHLAIDAGDEAADHTSLTPCEVAGPLIFSLMVWATPSRPHQAERRADDRRAVQTDFEFRR